jgi:hypothetical protein
MKTLHKPNLYGWSAFNEERNLDFHSVFWCGPQGNVAIDPLPQSAHDRRHVATLGGVQDIIVTNSDHRRAAAQLAAETHARVWVPLLERAALAELDPTGLTEGDEPVPGLRVLTLHGSKTPGEVALVIEGDTLVVGDLVRGHRAGRLNLLPDAKLADKAQALESLSRLAALKGIEAVLVGDGWPVFQGGSQALERLLSELGPVLAQ